MAIVAMIPKVFTIDKVPKDERNLIDVFVRDYLSDQRVLDTIKAGGKLDIKDCKYRNLVKEHHRQNLISDISLDYYDDHRLLGLYLHLIA